MQTVNSSRALKWLEINAAPLTKSGPDPGGKAGVLYQELTFSTFNDSLDNNSKDTPTIG